MAHAHSPGFEKLVDDLKARVAHIDIDEAERRLATGAPPLLVDVREESEWARGHLPGATHLSKGIIERDIEDRVPDKGAPVLLYCGGGYRSVLAADNLQKMGYTNVVSMDGGFRGWVARGLPVVKE